MKINLFWHVAVPISGLMAIAKLVFGAQLNWPTVFLPVEMVLGLWLFFTLIGALLEGTGAFLQWREERHNPQLRRRRELLEALERFTNGKDSK